MINKYNISNKGFTLIETVIVVAIIGILAVTLLPQFSSTLDAVRLRAAKEKLIDDLYYAQQYAIANHDTVWFDAPVGNSYSYGIYAPYPTKVILTDLSTGSPAVINLTNEYVSVSITTGGSFDYNWWGTPSAGGSIVLNGSATINIISETGFIHVP